MTAPATDRDRALSAIAHGLTAATAAGGGLAPAMRELEAEGWNPATARGALAATNDQHPAALERGPSLSGGTP